jgi:hypothetical protein
MRPPTRGFVSKFVRCGFKAASKPLHEKIVLVTLRGGCESGGVKPELGLMTGLA